MRLAATLPNTSPVGIWLVLFPLWVQYKLTGEYVLYPRVPGDGNEDMRDIVVARTIYIDRILERVLPEAEQFVLLGAGYDTRAYGELASAGLRCFELDQPSTQRLKIDGLRRAGIDTSHVTFVPVDFSHEDAFDKLRAAGYDPGKRSIFLWEGVTLYLGEEDVRRTLREMRDRSGTGSVLVADFYGQRMIEHGSKSINKKSLELTNEAFSFGLELSGDYEAALAGFLESAEVRPLETVFLGRNHERGPLMVVAEVEV